MGHYEFGITFPCSFAILFAMIKEVDWLQDF